MNIALIIAGGKGERTKQDIPKQFLHIENKPLIIYTLESFETHPAIDKILVVCLEGWHSILWAYANQYNISKLQWMVNGGESGHDSIHNGIMELKKYCTKTDAILIHDANRGLVSHEIISNGISTYEKYGNAVTVIPCTEVVFRSADGQIAEEEVPRNVLFRTQTPQIFSLGKLCWAHEEAERQNITSPLAACSLMQALGEPVYFSWGSEKNIKITTTDDIDIFRAMLNLSDNMSLKK
ncbi:2-C-methyl-D-erythritol 4-phosphate cytidylyltransferase [Spirochaetia bacterium]|nr:2-C-methyl-D-erythritol 4-phosphate cytidylyltransferase [Spirochaetia bacterium]